MSSIFQRSWPVVSVASVALLCAVLGACAVSKVEPLSIPLSYKSDPKNSGILPGGACNSLAQIQAGDARADKLLGTRVHEKNAQLKADVSAAGDPTAWLQGALVTYLGQNGLTFQGGTGPQLLVSMDRLHTIESILRRSSYDARITLRGKIVSPSGRTCWEDVQDGTGGTYGYSGSAENYQEATNAAVDAAMQALLKSAAFRQATCGCRN